MSTTSSEKIYDTYDIIGTKWVIHILFSLSQSPKKFNQISEHIPSISDNLLSRRLKDLMLNRLVERHIAFLNPLQNVYELTPKGATLASFIPFLMEWANNHLVDEADMPPEIK